MDICGYFYIIFFVGFFLIKGISKLNERLEEKRRYEEQLKYYETGPKEWTVVKKKMGRISEVRTYSKKPPNKPHWMK